MIRGIAKERRKEREKKYFSLLINFFMFLFYLKEFLLLCSIDLVLLTYLTMSFDIYVNFRGRK
jgi:hypothetical protein